jgi:hypothetical protein
MPTTSVGEQQRHDQRLNHVEEDVRERAQLHRDRGREPSYEDAHDHGDHHPGREAETEESLPDDSAGVACESFAM